jgi:hypothetical protein
MVKRVEEHPDGQPAPRAEDSPTFAELQERCAALERQAAATADVLRLISQSPADLDHTLHVRSGRGAALQL